MTTRHLNPCDNCGKPACEPDEILCPACKRSKRPPYDELVAAHAESRFLDYVDVRPRLTERDVRTWLQHAAAEGDLEGVLERVLGRLSDDGGRLRLCHSLLLQLYTMTGERLRTALFDVAADDIARDAYLLQQDAAERENLSPTYADRSNA